MGSGNKLVSIFGNMENPRSHINQLHNLEDILLIGIISVICGAEMRKQMVEFSVDFFEKLPVMELERGSLMFIHPMLKKNLHIFFREEK